MAFVLHGDGAILLKCWQVMLWSGNHIIIVSARFDGENHPPDMIVIVLLVAAGVGLELIFVLKMATTYGLSC